MLLDHHRGAVAFKAILVAFLCCVGSLLEGQSPDAGGTAPNESAAQQEKIRIYRCKYANASELLSILVRLSGDARSPRMAVDDRTNSLIFLADDAAAHRFEEMIALLDTEDPVGPNTVQGLRLKIPALGPEPLAFDFSVGIQRDESVETLSQKYKELEQEVQRIADKISRSYSPEEADRAELQRAVRSSFEARQALRRAELTELAHRLQAMQQMIGIRDTLSARIVERRVADLLNPQSTPDAFQSTDSTATPAPAAGTTTPQAYSRVANDEDSSKKPRASLEAALWAFLAEHPVSLNERKESRSIAFVGIDYRGQMEADGVKEFTSKEIDTYINAIANRIPSHPELVNVTSVEQAMREAGFSVTDLTRDNPAHAVHRQKLLDQLRRNNVQVDSLLIGSLVHLGDAEPSRDLEFEITLEGYIDLKTSWSESAIITSQLEWADLQKRLPESGTILVMFSYEHDIREQMLPIAKKVTDEASAEFVELKYTHCRKLLAPQATHFLLLKDRQVVASRMGLMTESRLRDFVAKANDWLTPRSTGIAENSLVRIDCFINPGDDNIGSQQGGAFGMTTAVVATHEDQALLLGPSSIASYINKGYACLAVAHDASRKPKHIPLDIVFQGPVMLPNRSGQSHDTAEVELDTAIYRMSGVHGLTAVHLAGRDEAVKIGEHVLSGGFWSQTPTPPLIGMRSLLQWQSQTVEDVGAIYGQPDGAELFTVLCPSRPAPVGMTFNAHGRLVGRYALGNPTEKQMTHTVFQPDATHAVLQAALEKVDDAGLKAALVGTLQESAAVSDGRVDTNRSSDTRPSEE